MKERARNGFGADVIQLLIPHRRPFLMVDRVESFNVEGELSLTAQRHISVNEAVFEGHFPGWSLWPGVYTIEGLGQSSLLLGVLDTIITVAKQEGITGSEVVAALQNIDRGYHLRPGFRPALSDRLLQALGPANARTGMASLVDVKLLQPVFAGQRLDYVVHQTHHVGHVRRFEVEATVEGVTVARGTLGSAGLEVIPSSFAPR